MQAHDITTGSDSTGGPPAGPFSSVEFAELLKQDDEKTSVAARNPNWWVPLPPSTSNAASEEEVAEAAQREAIGFVQNLGKQNSDEPKPKREEKEKAPKVEPPKKRQKTTTKKAATSKAKTPTKTAAKSKTKTPTKTAAKSKTPIKNDIDGRVAQLSGVDPTEALKAIGMPVDVEFEDSSTKEHKSDGTWMEEKKQPDWCFLVLDPAAKNPKHRRMGCVSMDGKRINTRFLTRKKRWMETEMVFGKPISFKLPETALVRIATVLACAPPHNGLGVID